IGWIHKHLKTTARSPEEWIRKGHSKVDGCASGSFASIRGHREDYSPGEPLFGYRHSRCAGPFQPHRETRKQKTAPRNGSSLLGRISSPPFRTAATDRQI